MKLTLLLLPLLLLSSCTMNMDEKKTTPQPVTDNQSKTPGTPAKPTENTLSWMKKDFWSGFTLTQTEDETTLSYSGKTIETWSNTPPKKLPYTWPQNCNIISRKMPQTSNATESNNPCSYTQYIWDWLSQTEKKKFMKEYFWKDAIRIEKIDGRFFKIYDWFGFQIYDIKTWNLQVMLSMWEPKIEVTNTGIQLNIDYNYKDSRGNLVNIYFYDSNFRTLLSTKYYIR